MSRLIIMPDNYWKMQLENIMLMVFIIWLFLTP